MLFLVIPANRSLGLIHQIPVNRMPSPVIILLRSEVNVHVVHQPLFKSLGNLKGVHTNI